MHILNLCRDPYGELSEPRQALLEQLLESPDQCTWERARGVIIRDVPIITLEMAVKSIRWNSDADSVPDPFTLYRALRFAVDYATEAAESDRGGICR